MPRVLVGSDMTISGLIRPLQDYLNGMKSLENWQVLEQGFNQWLIEVIDPSSLLHANRPEFFIVLLSPRFLEDPQAETKLNQFLRALGHWKGETRVLFSQLVVGPLVAGPLIEIPRLQQMAESLNQALSEFQAQYAWFQVIDLNSFFVIHGWDKIYDPRYEILARMYFSPGGIRLLAQFVARYLSALTTSAKKVLVLDLDNTLWGGILGEEGLEGIKLGGDGIGEAFSRFQKALLTLKNQGILLTICSKNNENDVLEVFEKHPGMILQLTDFVGHQINWDSKVDNIQSLSKELNLGLNSFAIFDDSAFEREQMRRLLPEVEVLEVPDDPALYVKVLSDYWGFDKLVVTHEDQKRSTLYQTEAQRKILQKKSPSLEEFYHSLGMIAEVSHVNNPNVDRVFQLIQKTNQFNLTTKRYTEKELYALMHSPSDAVYMLRLKDKLGESGITGVLVFNKKEREWIIDNFLMSCRIIGRTVEYAVIQWLADKARKEGIKRLVGRFIPTAKNQPAAQFFQNAGFEYDRSSDRWILDIEHPRVPKNYVSLIEKDNS